MTERISLFMEMKKGGYESCLVTTYNIDFPFYEDVLLRRMKSAGIHHHLLLMDQTMCAQAMNTRPPLKAGRHYSLGTMAGPGAFHPKVLILLGKSKGLLAVGSHNLTLSGFGTNLEITNVHRYNTNEFSENQQLFKQAVEAFKVWLSDYGDHLPSEVAESVDKLAHLYPWLGKKGNTDANERILFTSKSTLPLWEQAQQDLPDSVGRVVGISPFFDSQLAFLNTVKETLQCEIQVGIQKDFVQAPTILASLSDTKVLDSNGLNTKADSAPYIHAKALFLESNEGMLLMSGSANFSAPAWLDSPHRNAEAIILRKGDQVKEVFEGLGFKEFESAQIIEEVPKNAFDAKENDTLTIPLLIISHIQGTNIEITKMPEWGEDLAVGYLEAYGEVTLITCIETSNAFSLESKNISRPGEPLCIFTAGKVIARVIIHDVLQIQEHYRSGAERKFRRALGSLASDSPDIDLLFQCINNLTRDPHNISESQKSSSEHKPETNEGVARESLISDISDHVHNTRSGQPRFTKQSDIGLFLDAMLANLSLEHEETEEDVEQGGVDIHQTEDEQEKIIDKTDEQIISDEEKEAIRSCVNKLNNTIRKLEKYLIVKGAEGVPGALGICIICYQLYKQKQGKGYITTEHFQDLFEVLCRTVLRDSDPFFSQELDDEIHTSDEWCHFLAYVTWLAYYSEISLSSKPPISMDFEERDKIYWRSACWLYLNQQLSHNKFARNEAGELISALNDEKISHWYSYLTQTVLDTYMQTILAKLDGLQLCYIKNLTSKSFSGYRLVTSTDHRIVLASISSSGVTSQFEVGRVEIL